VTRRILVIASAALVLFCVLVARCAWPRDAASASFEDTTTETFDGDWWRTHGPIDFGELRLAMARDLISTNALAGLTRAEVLKLLGAPSWRDKRTGELGYELDEAHHDGDIDPSSVEELVIAFDVDDRVANARRLAWHAGD
jgi:hypothetical protein